MTEEKYLTAYEIAKECGVSPPTVYKWLKSGLVHKMRKLSGRRPGAAILLSDVEKFRNLGVHDV
jgi:predicted DNA-binding transcriptional regulator AlpA